MTQPSFRYEPLDVPEPFRAKVPILIGVMILTGLEHARRVAEIPGVSVPSETFDRLGANVEPAGQAKVATEIAVEQVRLVKRQGWAGLYLMSPGSMRLTLDVLRALDCWRDADCKRAIAAQNQKTGLNERVSVAAQNRFLSEVLL